MKGKLCFVITLLLLFGMSNVWAASITADGDTVTANEVPEGGTDCRTVPRQ